MWRATTKPEENAQEVCTLLWISTVNLQVHSDAQRCPSFAHYGLYQKEIILEIEPSEGRLGTGFERSQGRSVCPGGGAGRGQ